MPEDVASARDPSGPKSAYTTGLSRVSRATGSCGWKMDENCLRQKVLVTLTNPRRARPLPNLYPLQQIWEALLHSIRTPSTSVYGFLRRLSVCGRHRPTTTQQERKPIHSGYGWPLHENSRFEIHDVGGRWDGCFNFPQSVKLLVQSAQIDL